jgi:hypothetical protein
MMNDLTEYLRLLDNHQDTYSEAIRLHNETFEPFRDMFKQSFGVSTNPGWYPMVEKLLLDIRALPKDDGLVRINQIKEKFGGLRVYAEVSGSDDFKERVRGMIEQAERSAYRTCEFCSNPGVLRSAGWMRVTCEKHSKI